MEPLDRVCVPASMRYPVSIGKRESPVKLPQVDRCVESLAETITSSRAPIDHLWGIVGPATAGKSTALRRLHHWLGERSTLVPILVGPPCGALDAAPVATVEVGGQLRDAGLINGQLSQVLDPARPWNDKLGLLEDWLNREAPRVVLLCDGPREWAPSGPDDEHWGRGVRELRSLLLDRLRCRRVVTQEQADFRRAEVVHLTPGTDVKEWLQDGNAWGTLQDAARSLLAEGGRVLERRSPLEIRLLVGLAALTTPRRAGSCAEKATRLDIAQQLALALDATPDLSDVRLAWATLGLVRRPVRRELLETLTSDASSFARDVLMHSLLYEEGGEYILHDMLRLDELCRRWLMDSATERHDWLARYYAPSVVHGDPIGDCGQLLDHMEAVHHATQALRPTAADWPGVYFVEQVDAMARTFSLHKLYEVAVNLYRQAISLQPHDDYAHHYLAFNLDRMGREALTAEQHFVEAVRLNPHHPWWWSRYVQFLVRRGKEGAARRAWREALDAIRIRPGDLSLQRCLDLHGLVLPVLLDRGLLEFAQEVLDSIPPSILVLEPMASLRARHGALLEARDYGAYLPAPFVEPEWWKRKAPLLYERLRDGHVLEQWLACRVESIDVDSGIALRVARIVLAHPGRPELATTTISWDNLEGWSLGNVPTVEVGDFLEIGVYRNPSDQTQVRLHRHPIPQGASSTDGRPWTTVCPIGAAFE